MSTNSVNPTAVSLVIPVYNRSDELTLTLQSVLRQTLSKEKFEVIIADDGSSEDIPAVLKGFPDLRIKYVFQPDEGFRVAAARNLGVDGAEGQIIVYSDNGILLSREALERHIANHDKNDDAFVALGNVYGTGWDIDPDGVREILAAHDVDTAIGIMKEKGVGDGRGYLFDKYGSNVDTWYIPWLALWGGHFSVNASFVKRHGIRWEESFVTWGGEDNEYGIQLCDAGARLCFCPGIEVAHYPTPKSKAITAPDEAFKKAYAETKQHVLSLHPGNKKVELWCALGSSANDSQKRLEFCGS